jgi:hypothetical protein
MCDEEPMQTPKLKITNENEIHHGYQYKDGLNILQQPFQKEGSCVPGGFYYTDEKNLRHFYNYGIWIRCIEVPPDALIVKDPNETCGVKWRCDKIILKEKYPLYDLNTIKKFNLYISKYYIEQVCILGKTDILEWWLNTCKNQNECMNHLMNFASVFGHVDILELLKNSGFQLNYSVDALDRASQNGYINVLNWWLKSGLELKYTYGALDFTYRNKNCYINLLDWWKKSGLELKYISSTLDEASKYGRVNVLEWWKNSGLPLEYDEMTLNLASYYGHVNVLEWWKNSGLPLKYDERALDHASILGHINILDWWKNSGLPLKYNEWVLYIASYYNDINVLDVLEWWKNSGLPLKYDERALKHAQMNGKADVINWWKSSGLLE